MRVYAQVTLCRLLFGKRLYDLSSSDPEDHNSPTLE